MNRLQDTNNPYLLQHADNPVEWYPWGPEAFRRATEQDRPIFLSIGYSTCHWCHVMAHESFQDAEVARLMNATFINIKVDREERPDIDQLYMTMAQLFSGRGGWPLTIIMSPDQRPFFAATYIPKQNRPGSVGMLELIPRIAEAWHSRREEIKGSSDAILQALRQITRSRTPGNLLDHTVLARSYAELSRRFDERNGGFGSAPKFPSPHNLLFLLRYWKRTGEQRALQMVERTLTAMRRGGVFDQIGYGFHRYATDARWQVPHFEKMLYDQALLAMAYTETYQATGNTLFANTVQEVIAYARGKMATPEGGFATAEDADSEGQEGRFYTWEYEELASVLDGEELAEIEALYAIQPTGNYREEASGEQTKLNILYMRHEEQDLGNGSRLSRAARQKLFAHREKREHPRKDDKVLADCNGLMIAALARAGAVFSEPSYLETAQAAANFVLTRLRTESGALLHRYRAGEAAIPGYATDYAYLIWGLIELYEATLESFYLRLARELMERFIEDFWDARQGGGFFLTAAGSEQLLVRQRDDTDGAIPSADSVALLDLIRLGRLTQNSSYAEKADSLIRAVAKQAERDPLAFTFLLCALDFHVGPSFEVVIAGAPASPDTRSMVQALRRPFVPNKVVLLRPTDEQRPEILDLVPFLRSQDSVDGKATAYVCRDYTCALPVTDSTEMLRLLRV